MAKIGLLPLYVALYDKSSPKLRPVVDEFKNEISSLLKEQGNEVVCSPICCVENEFKSAVELFENNGVDAIVTVHLAYSPSLESCYVLSSTKLPIIMLDTTPDYLFDITVPSGRLMNNHGIHGVQDLACMLKRLNKEYSVFAGHYTESNVIKNVSDAVKAIASASALKNGIKVGMVGEKFSGMGDFLVPDETLKNFGITKVYANEDELQKIYESIDEEDIKLELEKDKTICDIQNVSYDVYKNSERVSLTVRKWIKNNNLDGFSMNFESAGSIKGFYTMPFSEASKAMAKGIGYAGEGDVLTAGICSALIKQFPNTSFCEMFCPDWKNGTIYISHMGEFNLSLLENRHMLEKNFVFADAFNPTCILGHAKGGRACFINVSPNAKGSYDVILADVEMLSLPKSINRFDDAISGWFKPNTELDKFLAKFSELGGTHHSVLVYGVESNNLKEFAKALGLNYHII